MNAPSSMHSEQVVVPRSDLEPVVLPRLLGNVFHVTSRSAFQQIVSSGGIRSNAAGDLSFTFPQSENSYGRQNGYVCLFDFRNASEDILSEARMKFNFLKPSHDHDPVYLFLKAAEYAAILPWTDAPVGAMAIPYVEAWYPGDVSLSALDHALCVTIIDDDAGSAFRGVMRGLQRDKSDLLDSGRVVIEARTLRELRQRTEEWVQVAQDAGLTVPTEWALHRAAKTDRGYQFAVRAVRAEYWQQLGIDWSRGEDRD